MTRSFSRFLRFFLIGLLLLACLAGCAFFFLSHIVSQAYRTLPSLEAMTDYRPKVPLRVYTANQTLIGEFGEERRNVFTLKEIPKSLTQAVLATEDERFYEHGGIDLQGIARAGINNLKGGPRQGASTITQQVARNFFLTPEQTFKRKFFEALLAFKIEDQLSKDQILEIYMNQIYLGQRAYGFSSAAQVYFGKNLSQISLAESAILAGLPKAPSAYNPVVNPKRSRERQVYILGRMLSLKYISQAQYQAALHEKVNIVGRAVASPAIISAHAEYVAEMARQFALDLFKDEAYTRGLKVYTTILNEDQEAAYQALRLGVLTYDQNHGYRGPEGFIDLSKTPAAQISETVDKALDEKIDSDGIFAAVVLEAAPNQLKVQNSAGEQILIGADGLKFASPYLSSRVAAEKRIRAGSIIRIAFDQGHWFVIQLPEVSSAFVATNTHDGSIRAMVGGFDFNLNKFNRVQQAWRQPGSSFKPFIYSASLEKGIAPATLINDAPFTYDPGHGSPIWSPKNYDGKNEGPMTMRRALTFSKNLVSVRIMDYIGPKYAQEYASRFGFDPDKNPAVLTLALGAGSVTPLQMAGAYSVFANGGYKVDPYLISKITDSTGKVLYEAKPALAGNEDHRVLSEANAFIMDTLLKDVAQRGTAAKASAQLKRQDLAGKTGTTNDAMDAWFAGYQPDVVGIAWVGFDQPRSLGSNETGGGVALPIWIDYMRTALKDKPVAPKRSVPEGIVSANGDWFLSAYAPGAALKTLGVISAEPKETDESAEEMETKAIHDKKADDTRNELF